MIKLRIKDVALARARLEKNRHREKPWEQKDFLHHIIGQKKGLGRSQVRGQGGGTTCPMTSGNTPWWYEQVGKDLCRKQTKENNVKKMSKDKNELPHGGLPPLPERAIKGLSRSWSPPNGETFHTVSLWEFTNLYVILGKKDWFTLSKYLKGVKLAILSHQLDITQYALKNIRDDRNHAIVVPNLKKLCEEIEMDLNSVERSLRGVKFNSNGEIEHLKFPSTMDIYAWRAICHIPGDGNVNKRKHPDLRWTQHREKGEGHLKKQEIPPKKQRFMRALLERLSRLPGGYSDTVNYPKVLTYTMMGTMPGLKLRDLRSTKFLQFILDLPPTHRDYKIQFLAAFIVDDGCISKDISFTQKSKKTLQYIIRLCDQLGYDHSHIDRQERDGMHNFQLRQRGIEAFYVDIYEIMSKEPLLGLWHKQPKLQSRATSFSTKRGFDNRLANDVYITIISVLGDHIQRKTN